MMMVTKDPSESLTVILADVTQMPIVATTKRAAGITRAGGEIEIAQPGTLTQLHLNQIHHQNEDDEIIVERPVKKL